MALRATGFKCIGKVAQNLRNGVHLYGAPQLFAAFNAFDDTCLAQDGEMAGNHRKIHSASMSHLTHSTRALIFRKAHKQGKALGI